MKADCKVKGREGFPICEEEQWARRIPAAVEVGCPEHGTIGISEVQAGVNEQHKITGDRKARGPSLHCRCLGAFNSLEDMFELGRAGKARRTTVTCTAQMRNKHTRRNAPSGACGESEVELS